jgi:hypothetical protein
MMAGFYASSNPFAVSIDQRPPRGGGGVHDEERFEGRKGFTAHLVRGLSTSA